MQYFLEIINSIIQDRQLSQYIFIGISAGATFAFVLSMGYLLSAITDPTRKRLAAMLKGQNDASRGDGDTAKFFRDVMGPAASVLLPSNSEERGKIQQRLIIAGFRGANGLTTFYAIKTVLAVSLPLIILLACQLSPQLAIAKVIYFCLCGLFIGLVFPNYVLTKLVARRQKKLRAAFPDALDLLVVCVESGLGLTNAIARVAQEMELSHPELSADLALINKEIMVGVPRDKAFKNLSERTGLQEIKSLTALLDQSMRFGTSIAEALRVYAEEFRDKRMQLAEEKAAKIGTKMIFPLTFFIWPSFFIIAAGPAILKLMEAFNR